MGGYPCPGDPAVVRALAADFEGEAAVASEAHEELVSLASSSSTVWSGAAADAFGDSLGKLPPKLLRLSDSYRLAASSLRSYAARLQEFQDDAEQLVARYGDAHLRLLDATAEVGANENELAAMHGRAAVMVVPEPTDHLEHALTVWRPRLTQAKADIADITRAVEAIRADAKAAAAEAAKGMDAAHDAGMKNKSWLRAGWDDTFEVGRDLGHGIAAIQSINITNLFVLAHMLAHPTDALTAAGHFLHGLWDGTGGAIWGLARLNYGLTFQALYDPRGAAHNWSALGGGLWHSVTNPDQLVHAVLDLDTMQHDPARWAGRIAPDIVLAVLSGGETEAIKAAKLIKTVEETEDVASAASKLAKLNKTERAAHITDITRGGGRITKIEEIEPWLETLRNKINTPAFQALNDDEKVATLGKDFKVLAGELDVSADGRQVALYSGKGASEPAAEAGKAGMYRIDDTPGGKILAQLGTKATDGRMTLLSKLGVGPEQDVLSTTITNAFWHSKTGAWTPASVRFVKSAGGAVAFAHEAKLDRVFLKYEIPAALENPNIKRIITDLPKATKAELVGRLRAAEQGANDLIAASQTALITDLGQKTAASMKGTP
jgi:uncharacterized protein YukE